MKVLFYLDLPLAWAPGGYTTHIRQTEAALRARGIEVAWLHADAPELRADIVHYWSAPPNDAHLHLVRAQGCRIVHTTLIGPGTNRTALSRRLRSITLTLLRKLLGPGFWGRLGLGIFREADAIIFLNPAERDYARDVFHAPADRLHIVPNGIEPGFVPDPLPPRGDRLLCVGHIQPNKNQLAIARAARAAKIPVTFIGAIFPTEQKYGEEFRTLVDGDLIRWEGPIDDRTRIAHHIATAAGLLLASNSEAAPLVILEALACKTPVMATDLRQLRSAYGPALRYSPPATDQTDYAAALHTFHTDCLRGLRQDFPVLTWPQSAARVAAIYETVLAASSPQNSNHRKTPPPKLPIPGT